MKIATIGFFDGVHIGHQALINKVVKTAKKAFFAFLLLKNIEKSIFTAYFPEVQFSLCPGQL